MNQAILAIDTAGPVVGLALVLASGAEREWSARAGRGADAAMLPELAAMLDALDEPLGGVAVTVGPGAFTGLRVGLAIATGVAFSRSVPVFPMGALAARALLCPGQAEVLALLDARKSRFYGARFSLVAGLECLAEAEDAELQGLLATCSAGCVAAGEGAVVAQARLEAAGLTVSQDAARSPVLALARHVRSGAVAPVDPGAVRLHYVRAPDAKVPRRLSLLPQGPSAATTSGTRS